MSKNISRLIAVLLMTLFPHLSPAQSHRKAMPLAQQKAAIFKKAKSLSSSGQYDEASQLYFRMSRSPTYADLQTEVKYILGVMLYEMKLFQAAGFVFYDVVQREARQQKRSKYLRLALEKLSQVTNYLESDILLKFAIGKVQPEDFPQSQQDMFYYRVGDLKLKNREFKEAADFLGKVPKESSFYSNAKYKQGIAYSELGDGAQAFDSFADLEEVSEVHGTTDTNRVNALLGKARVAYQKKAFEQAIELYRDIPRDTPQWHDSLFERSWAMLRAGQFRSALSNFHTLHSTYYKDFYIPESLLLRGIVYLYICRWDEMEKTLDLFDRVYKPIHRQLKDFLSTDHTPDVFYSEVHKARDYVVRKRQGDDEDRPTFKLPYNVLRYVMESGDIKQNLNYMDRLEAEQKTMARLSSSWKRSGVGLYSSRILKRRITATKDLIGSLVRRSLFALVTDLRDLSEQGDFLRLEQVSGQKEFVRKQMTGQKLPRKQVDQDAERDFYVQNGYEYWPFRGEYWLDELGNYHYVGVQNCKK